jgi:hypothetical protein
VHRIRCRRGVERVDIAFADVEESVGKRVTHSVGARGAGQVTVKHYHPLVSTAWIEDSFAKDLAQPGRRLESGSPAEAPCYWH